MARFASAFVVLLTAFIAVGGSVRATPIRVPVAATESPLPFPAPEFDALLAPLGASRLGQLEFGSVVWSQVLSEASIASAQTRYVENLLRAACLGSVEDAVGLPCASIRPPTPPIPVASLQSLWPGATLDPVPSPGVFPQVSWQRLPQPAPLLHLEDEGESAESDEGVAASIVGAAAQSPRLGSEPIEPGPPAPSTPRRSLASPSSLAVPQVDLGRQVVADPWEPSSSPGSGYRGSGSSGARVASEVSPLLPWCSFGSVAAAGRRLRRVLRNQLAQPKSKALEGCA